MRIKNGALGLSGTDLQSDITSDAIWLGHIAHYSIQLVFTGTPDGAFKLQASNDEGGKDSVDVNNPTITNWTDISGTSTNVTAAGSLLFNIENCGYRWVRLVWTDSSSGDPSAITVARYNVKGV